MFIFSLDDDDGTTTTTRHTTKVYLHTHIFGVIHIRLVPRKSKTSKKCISKWHTNKKKEKKYIKVAYKQKKRKKIYQPTKQSGLFG